MLEGRGGPDGLSGEGDDDEMRGEPGSVYDTRGLIAV